MKEKEINGKGLDTPPGKMKVAFDFDGVIHSYKSGWQGADVIPDTPVEGAIRMLINLISMYTIQVCIFSSRNFQEGGIEAMKKYLIDNGLQEHLVDEIEFPLIKEGFHLFIDDRAFAFEGTFPSIDYILNFKAWNKRDGKKTKHYNYIMC